MRRSDTLPLGFLATVILLQFSPLLFTGRSFFIGDLTYYYHPWHALPAEMLQRGALPLWNPYSYMGIPLHAVMQGAVFSPASLPFHLFSFPFAYKLQLLLHHGFAALLAYLWMRPLGRPAGILAGAVFSLGGFMAGHPQLVNWTTALAWWPAFFLFSGSPLLLGLALACSLSAGYPPIWAGMAASALVLRWLWKRERWRASGLGLTLGLGLAAIMLLPGREFLSLSTRSRGVPAEDRTIVSLHPADLTGYLHPTHPPGHDGWDGKYPLAKLFYVGWVTAALAAAGLATLGFRRALAAVAFIAAALLMILGGTNPLSARLWSEPSPLIFLRAPAYFAFLPLAVLIPLACRGMAGRRWAAWACMAACLELLAYGRGLSPTVPDRYFSSAGPLVGRLQSTLDGHRLMTSPLASRELKGWGHSDEEMFFDIKHRLYGLSNIPFHLSAATGLGESMLPRSTSEVIDFLFRLPGVSQAAPYLPWIDARVLAAKDLTDAPQEHLWRLTEIRQAARAWWIPGSQTLRLKASLEGAPEIAGAIPLIYHEEREDRFEVRGTAPSPGEVFISNVLYPGWRASDDFGNTLTPKSALGAFMSVPVSEGEFRWRFSFRSESFELGALITTAFAALILAALMRRIRGLVPS